MNNGQKREKILRILYKLSLLDKDQLEKFIFLLKDDGQHLKAVQRDPFFHHLD